GLGRADVAADPAGARDRRGVARHRRAPVPESGVTRRPAAVVAVLTGLLLLVLSGRHGYHRDELYFLRAGHHLAWGYPDQPPLTPLLARVMSELAPTSLVVLRLPSTLSAAAMVLLAGLMARDLGARRGGQLLA